MAVVATFPWLEPKPGSMGKPSPGFDVDLIDDNGKPCAPGEEGHLIIRTGNGKPAGMFDEYYRAEDTKAGAEIFTGPAIWHTAMKTVFLVCGAR